MKISFLARPRILPLILLLAVLLQSAGCKPQNPPPAALANSAAAPATGEKKAFASAEKNSYQEVTAHLDPGGSFYLYLSTEQLLTGLSGKVMEFRQFLGGFPGMGQDEQRMMGQGVDVISHLVKNSGLEDVSGVGMSSIARAPGFYHSKLMAHHYPGKNAGYLWSMFGKAPHALDGLDFLPATTAFAMFSDLDLALVWSGVQNEMAQLKIPEAEKVFRELPAQFERATGIKLNQLLASLGGEYGLVLTLDDAHKIAIPTGQNQTIQMPEPALMIVVKVKDDTIFNRVEKLINDNSEMGQQVTRVDKDGLRMRTLPIPLPLPLAVRPTWARYGDYLFIATTDTLVQEAVAVKTGKKPGWKSSDEFKKLSQDIPTQGNNFFCLSARFGTAFAELQKQAIDSSGTLAPAQSAWMQKFFGMNKPSFSYAVGANTPEGWLSVANANSESSKAFLASAAIVPIGLLAAIAIPNFVKARETAQHNACLSNLRQLNGAKDQWALENKKTPEATPSESDLIGPDKYIRAKPTCPSGGSYTLNPVGLPPACSKHGSAPQ